jgi:hypothetical protein
MNPGEERMSPTVKIALATGSKHNIGLGSAGVHGQRLARLSGR